MKNVLIPAFLLLLTLLSCEKKEPFVYEYETSPQYTWGFADFWGSAFSSKYDTNNNMLSLYALTDSLWKDDEGLLHGFGQYLLLNDIFVNDNDTLFPEGVYHVSNSTDAFSIAPGEEYKVDDEKYDDIGARIYFIEQNESYSVRKFIVDGSMTVTRINEYTRFEFDFMLDDETELKGNYVQKDLIYYDESQINQGVASQRASRLLKPMYVFSPEKFKTRP
ncbi:MAG: hypothetical protein VB102_09295 [Paludibacter sp.]|nr:hypothetical protein [Paludibacter sp.]